MQIRSKTQAPASSYTVNTHQEASNFKKQVMLKIKVPSVKSVRRFIIPFTPTCTNNLEDMKNII